MMFVGCTARVGVGYRVYDPYYRDYHIWDDRETVYYNRWAGDTHRENRELPSTERLRTGRILELAAPAFR